MIARNLSFDDENGSEDSRSPFSDTDQRHQLANQIIIIITYTSLVLKAIRCLEKMSSPPLQSPDLFQCCHGNTNLF